LTYQSINHSITQLVTRHMSGENTVCDYRLRIKVVEIRFGAAFQTR